MPEKGLCLVHSENSKETNVGVAQGARVEDVVGQAGQQNVKITVGTLDFILSITGSFGMLTEEKEKTLTLGLKTSLWLLCEEQDQIGAIVKAVRAVRKYLQPSM